MAQRIEGQMAKPISSCRLSCDMIGYMNHLPFPSRSPLRRAESAGRVSVLCSTDSIEYPGFNVERFLKGLVLRHTNDPCSVLSHYSVQAVSRI